jgi:hypothetical protein
MKQNRFKPALERIEDRCLLSTAVTGSLTPFVHTAPITANPTLGALIAPVDGIHSTAPLKGAQAASTIQALSTSTVAVVKIQNSSTATVSFQFRWSSSNSWTSYTLQPGFYQLLWANQSSALAPQIQFDWSFVSGWQGKSYTLSYNTYTGSGTPPTSAAKVYYFQSVSGGVDLFTTSVSTTNGLYSAYKGVIQDRAADLNGHVVIIQNTGPHNIYLSGIHKITNATGDNIAGNLSITNWAGDVISVPFVGLYTTTSGPPSLSIRQTPNTPVNGGIFFGFNFQIRSDGSLYASHASLTNNFSVQDNKNGYNDTGAGTSSTWYVLLTPNPNGTA